MAFFNIRLPEEFERGATGGPSFLTNVTLLASGFEARNAQWVRGRHKWSISYGIQNIEEADANLQDVIDLFYVCNGKLHSFRFKDWSDYEITAQSIGTGDGVDTTFQIVKKYITSVSTYERRITRPVAATLQVFVNGVLRTSPTHYTENLGLITFTSPPTLGHPITITTEFDIPARFDIDSLELNVTNPLTMSSDNIQIVEVLE